MQRRTFMLASGGLCLIGASTAKAQGFGDPEAGVTRVLMVGGFSLQTSQLAL